MTISSPTSAAPSLSPGEAARVVADVLAYFAESVEGFVRRRHAELRARGLTNDQIFEHVAAELPRRQESRGLFGGTARAAGRRWCRCRG
jgi:hypothetical protein